MDRVFDASIIKIFAAIEDICVLTEVEILEAAENFTDKYGNIEQENPVNFVLKIEAMSQIKRNSQ